MSSSNFKLSGLERLVRCPLSCFQTLLLILTRTSVPEGCAFIRLLRFGVTVRDPVSVHLSFTAGHTPRMQRPLLCTGSRVMVGGVQRACAPSFARHPTGCQTNGLNAQGRLQTKRKTPINCQQDQLAFPLRFELQYLSCRGCSRHPIVRIMVQRDTIECYSSRLYHQAPLEER